MVSPIGIYDRCVSVWANWQHNTPEECEERLVNFRLLQSYHSTRLDGYTIGFRDFEASYNHGKLTGYSGDVYPLIAARNHRVAHAMLKQCQAGGIPLSVDLICGVQHALTCGLYDVKDYVEHEDRPGEFKSMDYVGGLIDAGMTPEDIEDELQKLVDEMPRVTSMNTPLIAAAYLHCRLLFLKPFAIGNGMTSRMIMNYWLMLNDHPPIIIESADQNQYQKCIELFDVQEDIGPLVNYLRGQTVEHWEKVIPSASPQKTDGQIKIHF